MAKESGERKKILVVDDDRHITDLLKLALEDGGYKVETANSGLECLGKLQRIRPDLVLLDVRMPEMGGWQVLESIKSDKKTKDIPVAMLTAMEPDLDEEQLKKRGAIDYIFKIVSDYDELMLRIKKIFDKIRKTRK